MRNIIEEKTGGNVTSAVLLHLCPVHEDTEVKEDKHTVTYNTLEKAFPDIN